MNLGSRANGVLYCATWWSPLPTNLECPQGIAGDGLGSHDQVLEIKTAISGCANISQEVQVEPSVRDQFVWKWTANQSYSVSLAYIASFHGQCGIQGARVLSKTKAPPRCKFFIWLSHLDCCWTSARLQRQNLPNNGLCAFCN
jgi:hypothetical protein